MSTLQIIVNDGLSTLYIPERGEIWRDNAGNSGNSGAGQWVVTRVLLSAATPLTAIALSRRPISETMRRDPSNGWVYVPTFAGTLFSGPRYLEVINPPALGVLGEVSMGTDFGFAFWQFNPFNNDLWSLEENTSQFRIYDKATGDILNFFDADDSGGSFSGGGQFVFTAADKLWVLKQYNDGSNHCVLQRYDASILPDGALSPEFELDLDGVGCNLVYDPDQNALWFTFNPVTYGGGFSLGELKKFDLSSETVTLTVTLPTPFILDSSELEPAYIKDGVLWIVSETDPGMLQGINTTTGAIVNSITLTPYESEGCFSGTIAYVDDQYVWHGDAGCGAIYRTEIGSPTCVPCLEGSAVYGREGFSSGDVGDVDGQALEGGGQASMVNGSWQKVSGDSIGIDSGVGVHAFATPVETVYRIIDSLVDPTSHSSVVNFTVDHLTDDPSIIDCGGHVQAGGDGYRLRISMSNSQVLYSLLRVDGGTPTTLVSKDPAVDDVPAGGTGAHVARLCANCVDGGDTVLIGVFDGVVLFSTSDGNYPSGEPGCAILDQDGAEVPRSLALTQVDVAGCRDTVPGGGGDGGGGGGDPVFPNVWWNGTFRNITSISSWRRGRFRPETPTKIWYRGMMREVSEESSGGTFVLDPDDPSTPDNFDPGCLSVITPFPTPVPVGDIGLGLYNLTKNLLNKFSPFNCAITGSSAAGLSGLLSLITSFDMQLWFVPAFRQEQTEDNSGRGRYDHTANMTKIGSFPPTSSPRIPLGVVFDETLCRPCWENKPPTEAEVEEGCGLFSSIFGVPAAIRVSPTKLRAARYACNNVRIGMAQFGGSTGYDADGFGDNYDGYIDAQVAAATSLSLDGILYGLNPFKVLKDGWLPQWTDSYLQDKLEKAVVAPMCLGVYLYTGYPPSPRLLQPSTNGMLQTVAAGM